MDYLTLIGGIFFVASLVLFLTGLFRENAKIKNLQDEIREKDEYILALINERNSAEMHYCSAKVFSARYYPSESDYIKYKDEKALLRAARKRLLSTITSDVAKEFPEPLINDDGAYEYCFRVGEE